MLFSNQNDLYVECNEQFYSVSHELSAIHYSSPILSLDHETMFIPSRLDFYEFLPFDGHTPLKSSCRTQTYTFTIYL
jgi:hypothetical protein